MFKGSHSWRHFAVFAIILHCPVFSGTLRAQNTVHLNEVQVSVEKTQFGATGKKLETLDSAALARFQSLTLAQALCTESSMHIKSYGPGALATSAFRGGSAAQTAVVWNGINIQSRMLGQVDLNLLPTFLFDAVTIQCGSSSALWGSGAVGGSILLDSKMPFGKGKSFLLSAGGGSFGNATGGFKYNFSSERFVSTTKVWGRSARNNFRYQNPEGPSLLQAQHAGFNQKGVQQEFRYKISTRQILTLHAWLSAADRELPSFQGTRISAANQSDRNHRFLAELEHQQKNLSMHFKSAFLHEQMAYDDSLSSVFSASKVNTFILETDNYLRWQNHLLNFGMSASSSQARSSAYGGLRNLSFISVIAGNTFRLIQNRLQVQVHLRQDVYAQGAKPFTFNLGAEQKIGNYLSAQVGLARVYRHPTLNELYWQPGGNPSLLPETGYSVESSLSYVRSFGPFKVQCTAAAFSRKINNWILWVPGAGGNPSPLNLLEVWSRGTETTTKCTWSFAKGLTGFCLRTAYVLSTTENSALPADASLHKQLIYTPRYTGNGTFFVQYKKLRVDYTQLYVGYRFTNSDNGSWLNPFTTGDVRASLRLDEASRYSCSLLCSNLFNQAYAMVLGRPAALRYYEFTFIWQPKI